jgi:hypothetical protein
LLPTPSIKARAAVVAIALLLLAYQTVFATAGLAEWEIATPGGNRISHIDPLKKRHGTCLRKADDTTGLVLDEPARIYVEELEWWQYYPGHVVGKGRGGLFVFNEATHAVRYFKTEADLRSVVTRERLGQPISPRKTPADGWNEAWMPLIRERCRQFEKDSGGTSHTSEEVKAAMRRYCDQVPAR